MSWIFRPGCNLAEHGVAHLDKRGISLYRLQSDARPQSSPGRPFLALASKRTQAQHTTPILFWSEASYRALRLLGAETVEKRDCLHVVRHPKRRTPAPGDFAQGSQLLPIHPHHSIGQHSVGGDSFGVLADRAGGVRASAGVEAHATSPNRRNFSRFRSARAATSSGSNSAANRGEIST